MKRLPNAKLPLPDFQTSEEAARYFDSHSVAEVWKQLPEVKGVKLSKKLEQEVRERRTQRKSPISIRLDDEQIRAAKRIAATKSVGYQTQLRMWIAEGIQREAKR